MKKSAPKKAPCLYQGHTADCPFRTGDNPCAPTRHHKFWPRRSYNTTLERRFRNLPMNIVKMCQGYHKYFHLVTPPPPKPSIVWMRKAVSRYLSNRNGE